MTFAKLTKKKEGLNHKREIGLIWTLYHQNSRAFSKPVAWLTFLNLPLQLVRVTFLYNTVDVRGLEWQ